MKKNSFKCPATAYITKGSDPPEITKLGGEHNHGVELLINEVRDLEKDTIIAAAMTGKVPY